MSPHAVAELRVADFRRLVGRARFRLGLAEFAKALEKPVEDAWVREKFREFSRLADGLNANLDDAVIARVLTEVDSG